MNSLEIRETKIKLIGMVNSIQLPMEVKRLIVQDVMNELNIAANQEIDLLLNERNAANGKAQGAAQAADNATQSETK